MLTNKRVLITGASGFIGRNLILRLNKFRLEIGVLFRSNSIEFASSNKIKEFRGDIKNYNFVNNVIQNFHPHIVFHLAADKNRIPRAEIINHSINSNLIGSLNIFQALANINELEKVIVIGTLDEYGNIATPFIESQIEKPNNAYGLSKLFVTKLSDYYSRINDLPVIVLRPSIAYGPWQRNEMFIPSLIISLLQNKSFEMTKGEQKRDFIFISDLIDLMIKMVKETIWSENVFNIGFGESLKINEIAKKIALKLDKIDLLRIGGLGYREDESMDYSVSIHLLQQRYKWSPKIGIDEGLDITISHYQEVF